eukprot:scaffold535102_cov23-Prasinocladus_malaysianus.AAC.1
MASSVLFVAPASIRSKYRNHPNSRRYCQTPIAIDSVNVAYVQDAVLFIWVDGGIFLRTNG